MYAVRLYAECQLWQMQIPITIKEKLALEKYINNLSTGFTFPHIAYYYSIVRKTVYPSTCYPYLPFLITMEHRSRLRDSTDWGISAQFVRKFTRVNPITLSDLDLYSYGNQESIGRGREC